jgi:hypothetical protein
VRSIRAPPCPNPDLAPGAGLARMGGAAGWGYDGLIGRILEEAQ